MTPRTIAATQDARAAQCSRAGCRSEAAHAIVWRNPRIHTGARTKTWLACAEHLEVLAEFLRVRDFPVTVSALPLFAAASEIPVE